jgi:uncharacterized protein DUF3501
MQKVALAEIIGLERYERIRNEFRRHIIDLKKNRRVTVGDLITFVFENHLIEITQQERIRPELVRLIGIDKAVSLRIGSRFRIPAAFEPGRSKEDNLSAVQYVRFPFPPEALVAFRDERQEAMIVIDHPNYQAQALFNPEVRRSLAAEV